MSTNPARLVALVAALAATVAMVASLLTFRAQRAHNATQLPAHCLGFVAASAAGQPVLVPVNLCDPANRAALQSQSPQPRQEQRKPSYSI